MQLPIHGSKPCPHDVIFKFCLLLYALIETRKQKERLTLACSFLFMKMAILSNFKSFLNTLSMVPETCSMYQNVCRFLQQNNEYQASLSLEVIQT